VRGALGHDVARALRRSAEARGIAAAVSIVARREWASALFEGARFTIDVSADDAPLDDWLAALPECDLPLKGYFVAGAEVMEHCLPGRATVEILAVLEA